MNRDRGTRPTKTTHSPSQARQRPDLFRGQPNLHHAAEGYHGHVVCSRCHAIWDHKHWHLDEAEFNRLAADPEVSQVICEGCEKVEREQYDGEVTLRSPLIAENEAAILGLIRNTEAHIREHNPIARIAKLTVEGDTIRVLTITPFLAERIGKELKKAYHGHVEFSHPERAEFIRVTWFRE